MSKIIYRVTAFVLAAVMLAGCISCDVTERHENVTQSYDKNQRFELVVTPPVYSEEFIERSAVSFADIGERAVLLIKNVKITPKQKTDLKNYFKTKNDGCHVVKKEKRKKCFSTFLRKT